MSRSPHNVNLVLKGGVLLAAFGDRRPTRDVDLQAHALSNDADVVLRVVREVASIEVDDGVVYDVDNASAETIRDEEAYTGVRVTIRTTFLMAVVPFHVDVNVGDPIVPGAQHVEVPRLLGGDPITVLGYRMETVHAEKIVTAVARGTANTRWRDFADVVVLSRRHAPDGDVLIASINAVAEHRHVELIPLGVALDGFADIAQTRWAVWRKKQQLDDRTPESFEELLADFTAFAEPAVAGTINGRRWNPASRSWS